MNDFGRIITIKIDAGEKSNISELDGRYLRLVSDGTPVTLSISASIKLTRDVTGSNASISIMNMDRTTSASILKLLKNQTSTITLSAGYNSNSLLPNSESNARRNYQMNGIGLSYDEYSASVFNLDQLPIVFVGSLKSVNINKNGEDLETVIEAVTLNYNMSKSRVSIQFDKGSDIKSIIKSVASNLPTVSDKFIINESDVLNRKISRPLSVNGCTVDVLNSLARQYGFTWWIDNNTFKCSADEDFYKNNLPSARTKEISAENGLIYVTPTMVDFSNTASGLKIDAMYNSDIRPGDWVSIRSPYLYDLLGGIQSYGTNQNKYGPYCVAEMDIELDTHSDSWNMTLTSFAEFANTPITSYKWGAKVVGG